ncbi:hypothetical protein K4L44_06360 [Halosquirtibacter laminarini]|uniref:Uncharacterized protein n=1 Tax=Halosquirtibacter laminarini TaxID=3374600 RepID=A0AC61NP26_9BACT|nr:hypothetical protein K4L44_06360 [Prolixibacteraceae bacterium]
MIKTQIVSLLFFLSLLAVQAQDNVAPKNNQSSSPAFMSNNLNMVDGVPKQYENFFEDLKVAIEKHNKKEMIRLMCSISVVKQDKKQWDRYLDHFWVGKEENKEYNGLITCKTDDIKMFEVINHQMMNGAFFVNCRLTTKKKKVLVKLTLKETAYGPVISEM